MKSEKRYTVKEIAGYEQVSDKLVYDWIKLGYIQCSRMPSKKKQGRIIIFQKDYDAFKELFNKRKD